MYHSVTQEGRKNDYHYSIDEKNFETQLKYLKANFEIISLSSLIDDLKQEHSNSELKIAITFDDGFKNNYTVVYPLLKRYKLPATIFLTTEFIECDYKSFLNWEEIQEMNKTDLITFGSHCNLHFNLTSLEYCDILKELKRSKEILEKRLERNIEFFSYPGGGFNKAIKDAVKRCGYKAAFKDRTKGNQTDRDFYELARISIDKSNESIRDFVRTIVY